MDSRYEVESIAMSGIGLPLYAQQALSLSADDAEAYVRDHAIEAAGLKPEHALLLAAARMEWLLRSSRLELSERFTEGEVVVLLNAFQGELFYPEQFNHIAGTVCDDLGVEEDDLASSGVAPLIAKIVELTDLQRVALGDALEQAWYAMREGRSPAETFESLGICLL